MQWRANFVCQARSQRGPCVCMWGGGSRTLPFSKNTPRKWETLSKTLLIHQVANHANINVLKCVMDSKFICKFVFSTWLFDISRFDTYSYSHALIHTVLIVSAILTMDGSGNKVKSWLTLFDICDDTMIRK